MCNHAVAELSANEVQIGVFGLPFLLNNPYSSRQRRSVPVVDYSKFPSKRFLSGV